MDSARMKIFFKSLVQMIPLRYLQTILWYRLNVCCIPPYCVSYQLGLHSRQPHEYLQIFACSISLSRADSFVCVRHDSFIRVT